MSLRHPTDDEILDALRKATTAAADGWATPAAVLVTLPRDARGISQNALRQRLKRLAADGHAATALTGERDRRFTAA